MVERVPTSIAGFDELIQGGLPKGSIILVSGSPGTGKSIFCAQIVYGCAQKGKKCLFLDLEQKPGKLEMQMNQFGWNPESIKKNLKIATIDATDSGVVDFVLSEIKKLNYDVLVLDSLDSISSNPLATDEIGKFGVDQIGDNLIPMVMDTPTIGRLKLKKIFNAISASGATAIVTSEKVESLPGFSRDTISEFLSDGIVALYAVEGEEGFRTLRIPKMRYTKQRFGIYSFEITQKGILVKPEN